MASAAREPLGWSHWRRNSLRLVYVKNSVCVECCGCTLLNAGARDTFPRIRSGALTPACRGDAMANITKLHINGTAYSIDADPQTSLLSVLRDQLDLTGSKYGCGEGQCGACTVLIDGNPRRSCITPVGTAATKQITTIEGLETNGRLHPLQEAFLTEGAMQCAYCTSGMIMTAVALLKSNPHPNAQQVSKYMEGNICRCGTQPRIVAAVLRASKEAQR
jgi:aerobic-type carbon monoxide dehydrogenase small subunit (CoxS/CutS family)